MAVLTLPNRDYEYEIEISYNSLMILSQMLICNTLFGADLHNETFFCLNSAEMSLLDELMLMR